MLRRAHDAGIAAALRRYKIAVDIRGTTYGAERGPAPSGPERSHGTDLLASQPKDRSAGDVGGHLPQDQFNADWLWENQRLERMAPGMVGGFGQEVIG